MSNRAGNAASGASVTQRPQQQQQGNGFDSLTMFRAGASFAKQHYLLTASYIVGLLVLQFATGFAVTPVQRQQFDQTLSQIDMVSLEKARDFAYQTDQEYRQSRGWFFTCDEQCHELYHISNEAALKLKQHEEAYEKAVSNARASVGIFSEYGVADTRDSFWDAYYKGLGFAKRMSYWDALFMSIGAMRRDESLMSVFLNWLASAVMNFTMGMISALISFMFHLGGLLFSYQASPLTGIGFFILAFCGAFAVIASYLVGAYVVAASTAYVTLKVSGMQRITFEPDGRNGRPAMRIRQHND